MTRPLYLLMCTALMMTPCLLPRTERRYAVLPALLGAVGVLANVLSDLASPGAFAAGFTPSRDLSEAVADPGNHFESPLFLD